MSDNSHLPEAEYIHAAYAEKVKESFISFAENLSVGQAEKSCKERFQRSLLMIKKARDLALVAITEVITVEPLALREESPAEALSAEDQAMIEHALSGTTGIAKPAPARLR